MANHLAAWSAIVVVIGATLFVVFNGQGRR
jgi:hypothetical protein